MTSLILHKHLFLGHGEREGVRDVVVGDPFHMYNPFWDVASVHSHPINNTFTPLPAVVGTRDLKMVAVWAHLSFIGRFLEILKPEGSEFVKINTVGVGLEVRIHSLKR